jgi:hypothetical protein
VVERICVDIGMAPEWIRLMDNDPAPFVPRPPPEWIIKGPPEVPELICVRQTPPPPDPRRLE